MEDGVHLNIRNYDSKGDRFRCPEKKRKLACFHARLHSEISNFNKRRCKKDGLGCEIMAVLGSYP